MWIYWTRRFTSSRDQCWLCSQGYPWKPCKKWKRNSWIQNGVYKFISHGTSKILERSPIKYKLVRSLFCLNPQKMIGLPEECNEAFQIVLSKLIEAKWRSSSVANDLLEQYKCFLWVIKKTHDFEFKNCKERVYVLLCAHINHKKEFQPLWSVFKLLWQQLSKSLVERGFSINTDVVTPNLNNETLVSLRTVYDVYECYGHWPVKFCGSKGAVRPLQVQNICL